MTQLLDRPDTDMDTSTITGLDFEPDFTCEHASHTNWQRAIGQKIAPHADESGAWDAYQFARPCCGAGGTGPIILCGAFVGQVRQGKRLGCLACMGHYTLDQVYIIQEQIR